MSRGAQVWRLLSAAHGEHEAARVLARLVGAVGEHGEDKVATALEAALNQQRIDLLDVITPSTASTVITVPSALAGFVIEAGKPADYDHLVAH